jgi:rare lipoprotein A
MKMYFNPAATSAILALVAVSSGLTGCAAPTPKSGVSSAPKAESVESRPRSEAPPQNGGRYYKDDGPGAKQPENLDQVPDAQPKPEPLHRYANDAYRIMGVTYTPDASGKPFKETGTASWYGRRYHDKPTASGEPYNMYAMTAAHRTLPVPSYAKVTHLGNGRSVVVRINDRGPFHSDRIIDLSYTAAYKLGLLNGPGEVSVELIPTHQAEPSPLAEPIRLYKATQAEPIQTTALSAPPPVAPEAVQPQLGEGVWLQLGAFGRKESAEALVARVKTLGADVPGVAQRETQGLFKVQAGPYASTAEAERVAARMQSELGLRAYKVGAPVAAPVAAPAAAAPSSATTQISTQAVTVGSASQPGIYLQVAAVSKPEAAEAMLARLQGQSLPGLHRFTAGSLTRVQVGPFSSADQAEAAAGALEKLLGFKPFRVVK